MWLQFFSGGELRTERIEIVARSMAALNSSLFRAPTDLAKSAELGCSKSESISIA
jgi:hypothetical protein